MRPALHVDPILAPCIMRSMSTVTLLGPQTQDPNLRAALQTLELQGPFVSISAGWQEREGEIEELGAHVGGEVEDLRLYAATEEIFAADRDLRLAHRQRQARLQDMQELYALQLRHVKDAARELFAPQRENRAVLRAARRQAISAVRRLDRAHRAGIALVHAQFEQRVNPAARAVVHRTVQSLRQRIDVAQAILITGGHVAVLVNRLRLLGGAALLAGKPIVAWSAGAMALAESIVLFHDQPPQGSADPEVFDLGLGLFKAVLPLPHAQTRLRLHDSARVAVFARRFAPAACLTLDGGACLHFVDGLLRYHSGSFQLTRQGVLGEVATRSQSPAADQSLFHQGY